MAFAPGMETNCDRPPFIRSDLDAGPTLARGQPVSAALDIRPARPEDAVACAAIKNDWIDESDWLPRVHPASDLERHYREGVIPNRDVRVTGDPVQGFIGFDANKAEVTSLFVATDARGQGIGKALLDQIKAGRDALNLWTFEANTGARRFYAREGFQNVLDSPGDNEEGLPDILLRWERTPTRRATPEDAAACAEVVGNWVAETPWIEARFSKAELTEMIAKAMPDREIFLIGDPVEGYLSLNPDTAQIGALYVAQPGRGLGKLLMERAKAGRDYLQLNTHEPNRDAQRFYRREGFTLAERLPMGDDGLPELRMEWRR